MPTLFEELEKVNFNKRIKIKARPLVAGYSLFLEFTINYNRQREYLKIKIQGEKPLNKKEQQKLYLAEMMRDKKEIELFANEQDFTLSNQINKTKFLEYFNEIAKKKTFPSYTGCYNHLVKFSKKMFGTTGIAFTLISPTFCNKFIEYLQSQIAQNTVRTYLNAFSAVLNSAVREKILTENPLKKGHIKYVDAKREFLIESELVAFAKQETKYKIIKNAFLFSCYTGLRLGDIKALAFKDIKEGVLYIRQLKTKGVERMKLSPDALKILEEQRAGKKENSKVFNLGTSKGHLNYHLRNIVKAAGITKHISFHCGRHTFATRCITNGVDIYTVSKLLGHRDIKHTQIYAKLIDTKKDEYIDKLPQML
jgi:integrase